MDLEKMLLLIVTDSLNLMEDPPSIALLLPASMISSMIN